MSSENSYLIDVEAMVDAATAGHLWAKPSGNHLRVLMRNVFEHRAEVCVMTKCRRDS